MIGDVTDAAHHALRALGLTEYGARAYAALVSLGPSRAFTVAEAARVPRSKAYSVLQDLVRRGWVEAEGGRPRIHRARPPRECFDRERSRLDGALDAALPALEAKFTDRSTRFAGNLWLLRGGAAVGARAVEMVARAREEVVLVASFPLAMDAAALPRALRVAVRRGARVRLVVPDASAPAVRPLVVPGVEVRVLALPMRLLIVDSAQTLAAFPTPRVRGVPDANGVWNPSPEISEWMAGALPILWGRAEPVRDGPRAPSRSLSAGGRAARYRAGRPSIAPLSDFRKASQPQAKRSSQSSRPSKPE